MATGMFVETLDNF